MQENMDLAKPNDSQKSGTYKISRNLNVQGELVPDKQSPAETAVKENASEPGAEAKWKSDDLGQKKPADDS